MLTRSIKHGLKAVFYAGLAMACLTVTLTPLLAATPEQEKSDKYYREAQEYLKKRDVNAAVIQLKNALKSDASNVAARLLLADVYMRLGQGAYAEKEIKAASLHGVPFSDTMVDLGRAYLLQGRFDDVLKELALDKATDANRVDVLVVRGSAELGLRHFDESEQIFRDALKIKPDEARAYVGLAQSLASRGHVAEAEQQVDVALKTQPDLLDALILKAELRRINRDFNGAIEWFGKAIAQRPNHLPARLGRAASYIDMNRDAEAEPDLKAVLSAVPRHPLARYLQALSLAKKKDYAGAKDMLLDTGSALDDHLPAMFLRGAVYYALGEFEQAQQQLTRYLAQVPQNVRARKILAATYIRSRQGAKAVEILKPLEEQPDLDGQTLTLLGSAYMQQGNVTKGSEYFEKAVEASPDQSAIRTQLAISRLAQGQTDKAEDDLEVALNLDKDSSQAGILLTLVQLRKGEFDGALKSAEQLQKSMPGNPLPANLLGAAWLGKGDSAKAREMFGNALKIKSDFTPARMNLAQLDLRENKNSNAKEEYGEVLKVNSNNVSAMMGLANIAIAERNPDAAVTWLKKAADANPNDIAPRLRLISYYSETGQSQKALTAARDLATYAPNSPQAQEVLGRTEISSNNPKEALAAFGRLTELAPKSAHAFTLLASVQALTNDVTAARSSLTQAIAVEPTSVPARVAMVELEMHDNRPDAAFKAADELKKIDPKASVGDMLRGDILASQKKFDDAVKSYETAMKLEDTPVLAIRRFSAQRAAGKNDAAYQTLEKWVAEKNDPSARNVLASAYLNDKNYAKAIEHSEKILALDKNNPIVLNNLAWAYQQVGDKRAKDYAERALTAAPQSPAVMDTLGWILVTSDDPKRGFDLLKKAVDAAPNQGDIRYHMAAAMQKQGLNDDARKELEKLLAADNTSVVNFTLKPDAEKLLKQLQGG